MNFALSQFCLKASLVTRYKIKGMSKLSFKNSFILLTTAVLVVSGFLVSAGTASATDDAVLQVNSITPVANLGGSVGYATAGGGYDNGWKWAFNITVPTTETVLNMKFNDWTNGSNIIPASGNMKFYSPQSSNASTEATAIGATNNYGGNMYINLSSGIVAGQAGRQVQIIVETQAPATAAGGSYSTSYGIQTNPDTTAPVISGTPSDMTVASTSSLGATVTYTAPTATDLADGTDTVTCSPASGTTFAIGTTPVACTVTDSQNLTATSSFNINVTSTYYTYDSDANTCSAVQVIPANVTADDLSSDACNALITTPYYQLSDNSCSVVNLTASQVGASDYTTSDLCSAQITSTYYTYDSDANTCSAVQVIPANVTADDLSSDACNALIVPAPALSGVSISGGDAGIVVTGDLTSGFTINTNGDTNNHNLDLVTGATANVPLAATNAIVYIPFKLSTPVSGLSDYFVSKGIPSDIATALANGTDATFYLKVVDVSGTETITLVDGFMHDNYSTDVTLRIDGDYPTGAYSYVGTLTDANDSSNTTQQNLTMTVGRIAVVPSPVVASVSSVAATNGTVTITLAAQPTVAPVATDFTATTSIDAAGTNPLTLTGFAYDGAETVTYNFTPITQTDAEQSVVVAVTLGATTTPASAFAVAASSPSPVVASVSSVAATNGTVTITLAAQPTVAPVATDFTATTSIDAAGTNPLTLTGFAYDGAETVTYNFTPITQTDAEQSVVVAVTLGATTTPASAFAVAASSPSPVVASVSSVAATNGTVTITLAAQPTVAPVATDFTATTSIDAAGTNPLTLTGFAYDGAETVTYNFTPITQTDAEQSVVVAVTLGATTTPASAFAVAASSPSPVVASVSSVAATNGTVTITLAAQPTVAPVATDFTATTSIDAAGTNPLTLTGFAYDGAETVTYNFTPITQTDAEQSVVVAVTLGATTTPASAFAVAASE